MSTIFHILISTELAERSAYEFIPIMLFSGDSDFVLAAKLARREGVDFVLGPMHANVEPQLFEHIDGMKSVNPNIQKHL